MLRMYKLLNRWQIFISCFFHSRLFVCNMQN